MSRSRKKHPIIKDNAITSWYWRPIRREWKQRLKKDLDDPDLYLRNRREITNDYDWYDWVYYFSVSDEHKKYPDRNVDEYYENVHKDIERYLRK